MLTRKVGQRVLLSGGRFHGAARITKVNPVNLKVTMEDGNMRVNAAPEFLSDLAEGAPVPSPYQARVTEVALLPTLWPGELVRLSGRQGVFVVIADKIERVNCTPLGGDGGRYWRAPRGTVTPLAADEVATIIAVVNA